MVRPLRNVRLIDQSFLNVDLMILSKILAVHLKGVLPFIGEDQTGFIKGPNSYNNMYCIFCSEILRQDPDTHCFPIHSGPLPHVTA